MGVLMEIVRKKYDNRLSKNVRALFFGKNFMKYDSDCSSSVANNKQTQDLIDALIDAFEPETFSIENIKKCLAAPGVDINAKDARGRSVLWLAVISENKDIVAMVLNAGADVNADARGDGRTILYASIGGNKEIFDLLLKAGADINAKDDRGKTPLWYACIRGFKEYVELFLKAGADIDARDNWASTPLMGAVRELEKDIVELLLARGADVNAKTIDGDTVLMYAVDACGDVDDQMKKKMVSHYQIDDFEKFMIARYGKNKEIIKLLLAHGADVNAKNNNGESALDIAKKCGKKEIIELLQEYAHK